MGRPRRAAVIETLHDVAATIQTEETATGVCERTVSAAANLLNFNQCTVLVREGEWLVPYATSADAPPGGSRRMEIDEGLAGKTYQTGQSYTVAEVTPTDETSPADASYQSGISVPIGEQGVFQAVETTPGRLTTTTSNWQSYLSVIPQPHLIDSIGNKSSADKMSGSTSLRRW